MTARVVLFIVFILITASILYTGNYKKHFNDQRDLSYKAFKADQKHKKEIQTFPSSSLSSLARRILSCSQKSSAPLPRPGNLRSAANSRYFFSIFPENFGGLKTRVYCLRSWSW